MMQSRKKLDWMPCAGYLSESKAHTSARTGPSPQWLRARYGLASFWLLFFFIFHTGAKEISGFSRLPKQTALPSRSSSSLFYLLDDVIFGLSTAQRHPSRRILHKLQQQQHFFSRVRCSAAIVVDYQTVPFVSRI